MKRVVSIVITIILLMRYIEAKNINKELYKMQTNYKNKVFLYIENKDYKKALIYQKKVLEIGVKLFGKNSKKNTTNYNNLGYIYMKLGKNKTALKYFNLSLKVDKTCNDSKCATTYNNIGLVYYHMKKSPIAIKYFHKALILNKKILGNKHQYTINNYKNLAMSCSDINNVNFGENIQYCDDAVIYYSKINKEFSIQLALIMSIFIKDCEIYNKVKEVKKIGGFQAYMIYDGIYSSIKNKNKLSKRIFSYLYSKMIKNIKTKKDFESIQNIINDMFDQYIKIDKKNQTGLKEGKKIANDILNKYKKLYFINKKYKKAKNINDKLQYISKMKSIDKELGFFYKSKDDYLLLKANIYYNLNNTEKANKIIKKLERDNKFNYIANFFEKEKKYKKAIMYYYKEIEYIKHKNDKCVITSKCSLISKLYIKLGMFNKIGECFLRYKDFVRNENKNGKQLCSSMNEPAMFSECEKLKGFRNKRICYDRKVYIYEKLLPEAKRKIIDYYIVLGDINNNFNYLFGGSGSIELSYYNSALKLSKELYGENSELSFSLYYKKGTVYLNDYNKNYNPKKALNFFEKSLKIGSKLKLSQSALSRNYLEMSNAYKKLNKIKLYKKYRSLYKKYSLNKKQEEKFRKGVQDEIFALQVETLKSLGYKINVNPTKLYYNAILSNKKLYGKYSEGVLGGYINLVNNLINNKKFKNAYVESKNLYLTFINNKSNIFQSMNNMQKKNYLKKYKNVIPLILQTANLYKITLKNKSKKIIINQNTFTSWLHYKGSIFDSENAIAILYANTKDKKVKAQIEELMSLKREFAKLNQITPPQNKDKLKKYRKKLALIDKKIDTLTTKISNKATNFKIVQELKKITPKDISKYLKPNELYIDFAKTDDYYYVFTIDKNNHIEFTQISTKDTKEIDKLITSFKLNINDFIKGIDRGKSIKELNKTLTPKAKEILSKLYSVLIDKYIAKLIKDKSSIVVSPDGNLRLLPFEALYNKKVNKYLIEQKEIKYIPNGKEFVRVNRYNTKSSNNSNTSSAVVFYNPNFNKLPAYINDIKEYKLQVTQNDLSIVPKTTLKGDSVKELNNLYFNPLVLGDKEAYAIKSVYKSSYKEFPNLKANERNLLKIASPKILHLSTHGFYLNSKDILNPMLKSGIALTGANIAIANKIDEGVVTALKLSGLNLQGTELVFLSACDTARVDSNSTDIVSALNKSFIQAGAKDIVSTLWSVSENDTANLVKDFYKKLKSNNQDYSKALREAKIDMIKANKHPFFWGAFIVNGK